MLRSQTRRRNAGGGGIVTSLVADLVRLLREHNARAPDQLLRERFGSKVGRGRPLSEESRRRRIYELEQAACLGEKVSQYDAGFLTQIDTLQSK